MNKTTRVLILILFTFAAVGPQAHARTKGARAGNRQHVKQRQKNQHHRIQQGVKSGELTKEEAEKLRQGQKDIQKQKKDYLEDGSLNKEERKDLHQKQNDASKEIYEEKHDEGKKPQ